MAGADRDEAEPTRDRHGRRPSVRSPVPELRVLVVAPAIGRAARRYPAGVEGARAHGGEPQPAVDRHRRRPRDTGPVPELPEEVVAPTIGRAARGHATRVPHTRTDRRELQLRPPDGRRARSVPGGGRGLLAELTGVVGAPAIGGAAGRPAT